MSKKVYLVVYTFDHKISGNTTTVVQAAFSSKEAAEKWLEENPNYSSTRLCIKGSQIEEWELK